MPLLESRGSGSALGFGLNSSADPYLAFKAGLPQTSSLQLYLDSNVTASYPGSGTDWYDLSGKNNHFKVSASSYSTAGSLKYMNFNASGAKAASGTNIPGFTLSSQVTVITFNRLRTDTSNWRTISRTIDGGPTDRHHVIVQSNGNDLGFYNNNGAGGTEGFNPSGYSVTSIPGYGTSTWVMGIWRYDINSPQYRYSYNNTPGTIRASISNQGVRYGAGPVMIGGYHNGNYTDPSNGTQWWGDFGNYLIWNTLLTDSECLDVWNKFRTSYGL